MLFLTLFLAALVIFALAIRGSLRRGPTLAQRYKSATPDEKAKLDKKMRKSEWLRANMHPLSGWEIVGAVIGFVAIMLLVSN